MSTTTPLEGYISNIKFSRVFEIVSTQFCNVVNAILKCVIKRGNCTVANCL